MLYTDRFIGTDNLHKHLASVISTITDQEIQAHYAGFLSVSSVTAYELAIKDIFFEFAKKKNKVLANVIMTHFNQTNGRIKIKHLRDQHIKLFGDKYVAKFNRILDIKENSFFKTAKVSITTSYIDLITCRHKYVHQGTPTLTLNEVINYYVTAKEVIHCLNNAMQR